MRDPMSKPMQSPLPLASRSRIAPLTNVRLHARTGLHQRLVAMTSTDLNADTKAEQRVAQMDPIAKVPLWTLLPVIFVADAIASVVQAPELEKTVPALCIALAVIAWWRWTVADVTRRAGFVPPVPSLGSVLKPAAKVALAGILTTLLWLIMEHQLRLPRFGLVDAAHLADRRSGAGVQALSALTVGLVAPAAEELFFRGSLFRKWRLRWGGGKVALLTSFLFGLGHEYAITTGLFALAMVLLYTSTRTIWTPIAAHMLNNLFPVVLLAARPVIPIQLLVAATTLPVQLAALVPALGGTFWLVRFIWRNWHTVSAPVDGVTAAPVAELATSDKRRDCYRSVGAVTDR
ncbi:MAG TPA: type II CAAX endopeptidase family protein [Polyangiaceae bacterium]|nr:type II CAAX endopeptidase family protein [Polyangiaceae bacterium]